MTGTTETWRKGRKILDGSLRPGAMISYRQMMQEKTRELLLKLRTNTKDFCTHVESSVDHLLISLMSYDRQRPVSLQGKLIMSLTYGYDVKDEDKILEAPIQAAKLVSPLILPGAAMINHLPFCSISNFLPVKQVVPNGYFQCGTFLHGSHTSAMNHWHV
jgi:hypothetical protein